MSYLHHIRRCTTWDPADHVPVIIDNRRVGMMRRAFVRVLADRPDLVEVTETAVVLNPRYDDFKARTAALAEASDHLRRHDAMARPRDEPFAVVEHWGAEPLAEIDRTATHAFGFPTFGQHVNGWTLRGGMLHLWVGRRAADRRVAPGKLDNLIAGGLPAGLTLAENLEKEGGEEAGFGPELIARARPVGAVSYRMAVPEGLRRDVLFCYDLEVPESVVPANDDGEVAAFELWPLTRVARTLAETEDFKFNVPLVILDFMIRHGALTPDDPDYMAIVSGLRSSA